MGGGDSGAGCTGVAATGSGDGAAVRDDGVKSKLNENGSDGAAAGWSLPGMRTGAAGALLDAKPAEAEKSNRGTGTGVGSPPGMRTGVDGALAEG